MAVDTKRLYEQVGARLRERRVSLGLRQADLVHATGLLRTSITNIEAGRQKPPLHVLYSICAALNIEVSDVLPPRAEVAGPSHDLVTIDGEKRTVPSSLVAPLQELQQELKRAFETGG